MVVKPKRGNTRRFILIVVIPLIALAAGFAWWLTGGRYVTTDNAYVGADKSLITPQVTGAIVAVHVVEGQKVKVGDPLFDIDPQPYEIALALARGRVDAAKVAFDNLKASYVSNRDQIKMGQDAVNVRKADYNRKNELATRGAGTSVDRDTSLAALIQAQQILEFVNNQQASTITKLGGSLEAPIEKFPEYMQAKAGLDNAERDLRNTKVLAPINGVATQVNQIEIGRVAPAGQPVFAVVADKRTLGRRQPQGIGHDLCPPGPARDCHHRRLPRQGVEGHALLDRAGDGRAILDPAAAERERQLGQGRATRAASLLLRPGRGYLQPSRRDERVPLDRHRARAHAQRGP